MISGDSSVNAGGQPTAARGVSSGLPLPEQCSMQIVFDHIKGGWQAWIYNHRDEVVRFYKCDGSTHTIAIATALDEMHRQNPEGAPRATAGTPSALTKEEPSDLT